MKCLKIPFWAIGTLSNLSYEYEWFFDFTKKKEENSWSNRLNDFINLFVWHLHSIQDITSNHFSRAVWRENFIYVSRGGIAHIHLSQWAVYRIVAIDVRARREGRDICKVGFYDPRRNQTDLNIPAIRDFLQKGAQPTETVHDILKKAGVFKELHRNSISFH